MGWIVADNNNHKVIHSDNAIDFIIVSMKRMSRCFRRSDNAGYMLQDIFNVFLFDFNMPINAPLIGSIELKAAESKYKNICTFLLQTDKESRRLWPEHQNQVFDECNDITLPRGFASSPARGANNEGGSQSSNGDDGSGVDNGDERKSAMYLDDFDIDKHLSEAKHWMINTVVFDEDKEIFCLAPVPDVGSTDDVQSLYALDASLCHAPTTEFYSMLLREYRESLAAIFPTAGDKFLVSYDLQG